MPGQGKNNLRRLRSAGSIGNARSLPTSFPQSPAPNFWYGTSLNVLDTEAFYSFSVGCFIHVGRRATKLFAPVKTLFVPEEEQSHLRKNRRVPKASSSLWHKHWSSSRVVSVLLSTWRKGLQIPLVLQLSAVVAKPSHLNAQNLGVLPCSAHQKVPEQKDKSRRLSVPVSMSHPSFTCLLCLLTVLAFGSRCRWHTRHTRSLHRAEKRTESGRP